MIIEITDFKHANKIAEKFDVVVSISDIHENIHIKSPHQNVLFMKFDDLDKGPGSPDMNDMKILISFLKNNLDKHSFLFHCRGGVSRSTAAALCLLLLKLKNGKKAVNALFKIKPNAAPNEKMVSMLSKIFKIDNLSKLVDEKWNEIFVKTHMS